MTIEESSDGVFLGELNADGATALKQVGWRGLTAWLNEGDPTGGTVTLQVAAENDVAKVMSLGTLAESTEATYKTFQLAKSIWVRAVLAGSGGSATVKCAIRPISESKDT